MASLSNISIKRPVFTAMMILALVVVGAVSYGKLGVDRLPSVDLPTVSIRTNLPGATPEEVESELTEPIEAVVNTVEGIDELRSISGPGGSVVIATFNLSRNIDVAAQDVRDRVATVINQLPDDATTPTIVKADNDSEPVITLALSSDRPIRELTELAEEVAKVELERSQGVGEVVVTGGKRRTINLWVDVKRLAAHNLPISTVREAVLRNNTDAPGGNLTAADREQSVRTMGRLTNPEAFNDIVIATVNGTPIRLKDVGYAEDGIAEPRSMARLNGVQTVSLSIRRQSGANTIDVIEGVKSKLDIIRAQLPADVQLVILRDQSNYIYAALHEIKLHLVLGSLLACAVVLLFMRDWRATIIASVAIPASVIATFGMMWLLNFTLNSVTMLALVLMVGVVIDDAIVVLENIFRYIEEKKLTPMQAAKEATEEIALAVLATTLSLVVIFVPVSFMSSISGRFLYQFGITAAVSVMVSLLVSFTLTPMMSSRMFKSGEKSHSDSKTGFYYYIDAGYAWLLKVSMRFRVIVAILAVIIVGSSYFLYQMVPLEYTPNNVDESEFQVGITAPEGTGLTAMDEAMKAVENEIKEVKGVKLQLTTVGGGFLGSINTGNIYIQMEPHDGRTASITRFFKGLFKGDPGEAFRGNYNQADVMRQVRAKLRKFRDLRVSVRSFPAFNIGGGNFDINIVIRGPNLEQLAQYGETLVKQSSTIEGVVDMDTTLRLDKPELRVSIDRQRAADLGIPPTEIGAALRLMVGGDTEVSRFRDEEVNEEYYVTIRLNEEDRDSPDDLEKIYLARQNGGLAKLSSIVSVEDSFAPARIDRIDRQRVVNVRGAVATGYALSDRLDAVLKATDGMNMPESYTVKVIGKGKELATTYREFVFAFALSILFMYMILASQYESLVDPLTILLSLPLAVPFALLSLWATKDTLNLYSALGILVLFGVVKKNSILQVDHIKHLRAQGLPRLQAIMVGNRDRLRPILMTTLSLVAGMLPLALGTGPGAEERRSVAIVVIGGQSLALLLTLLVTPVAYSLFDDAGSITKRLWRMVTGKKEPAPQPAPFDADHKPPAAH